MHSQTVAARHSLDNSPAAKPKHAGNKSPWRVMHERLQQAGASPRAARVAVCLEAYARRQLGTGRLVAAVFHEKIAAETGLSLATVRRALRELTQGAAPLYIARGTTGQKRTFRHSGGAWDMRCVFYEKIEDLPAFLAARDITRTSNVLDYEQRKREHRPDLLTAQRQLLTGELDEPAYQATVEQIDARARGRLPKSAAARKPARCLTAAQLVEFAADLAQGGAYRDLVKDGRKRVRQFHALHRHVFGGNGWAGCRPCELAVAQRIAEVDGTGFFATHGATVTTCGCGCVVVLFRNHITTTFADQVNPSGGSSGAPPHDCPHEQNRLLKLRQGRG